MAKKKFLKTVAALGAIGVASKIAYDKYKEVSARFEQEENDSISDEVRKYNAIFGNKVVEVNDEVFTGCEVKAIASNVVIDLGLAIFEKDVYIDFSSKCSNVTIVIPEGVNTACDVENHASRVNNLIENVEEDGIHTVYVIGTAVCSNIEIVPVNFYVDDDDDYEDIDSDDSLPENESGEPVSDDNSESADEADNDDAQEDLAAASENDDLEKMDDPDAEEDLCKLDGTEELTVEEVSK